MLVRWMRTQGGSAAERQQRLGSEGKDGLRGKGKEKREYH